MRRIVFIGVLALAACADEGRDYDSSAACTTRGVAAGTPAFEKCVREERSARMLEQQRQEYDQRKADDEYWRTHRYR